MTTCQTVADLCCRFICVAACASTVSGPINHLRQCVFRGHHGIWGLSRVALRAVAFGLVVECAQPRESAENGLIRSRIQSRIRSAGAMSDVDFHSNFFSGAAPPRGNNSSQNSIAGDKEGGGSSAGGARVLSWRISSIAAS